MITIPALNEGANQFDSLPASQTGVMPQTVFENEAPGITIPQNQNTLGQLIDAKFVESFGNPAPYDKAVANAYDVLNQPQAIGPQGKALYPGISDPINVGTYSGSIVGNNPIFVPSGNVMPLDPVLARRKAIDEAARARAMQALETVETPKIPQFKDQGFQKKLNEDILGFHNQMVKEAQAISPTSWAAVLKNPNTSIGQRYIRGMANFNNIVQNVDRITDQVTAIEEGMKDGSVSLNPEGKELFKKYKGMLGDFADYEKLTSTDMRAIEQRLQGIIDVNKYLNDEKLIQNIQAEITSTYRVNDKGMYYDTRTNKLTKYDDIIKEVADSLANSTTFSFGIENGYLTKEDIQAALAARLKNKQEVTGSMSQKAEWAFNFGRGIEVPNPNDPNAFIEYTNEDGKRGVVVVGGKKYESLADYNMSIQGTDQNIMVLDKNENPKSIQLKGVVLNDAQFYGKGVQGGRTIVQLGEVSVLKDGTIVQKATAYRPQMVPDKQTKRDAQVWTSSDELIILKDSKGQGTSAKSEIVTQVKRDNEVAGNNYEQAVTKMDGIRKKKLEGGQTTSSGSSYTPQQEQGIKNVMEDNNWTRQQAIEALKNAGKL
jgi:hypothetical protein